MPGENFFDFREKLARPQPAGVQPLTVSQLTAQIERAIQSALPATVHVRGEVSNLNLHHASGHLYFTLKDSAACIDCVMFRSDVARLKFMPADGVELLVSGRVAVYPQRGRYQLYVSALWPVGRGALELAFEQLCRKLKAEGLFDASRKKPLPRYPRRIALVTSRSTAALHDILKVLKRFPWIRLHLYDVPVQGEGAAEQIAQALRHLNLRAADIGGIDLIILARGGGSLEDLWAFNEEVVARAVAESGIPIITGIGHEVDISVADLVADYHAHTPTEAAQVATSNWRTVAEQLQAAGVRLRRGLRTIARDARQRLLAVERHEFFRRPTDRINQFRQLLDERQRSLQLLISSRLKAASARLEHFDRHLQAVSPQAVLRRGYSITTRATDGSILRSARDVRAGERLITRLADGTVRSIVEDQKQLPLFE